MRFKIISAISLLITCFTQRAHAELDVFNLSLTELSKVEVATETPITLIKAPSVVSVITQEDIAKLSANTLPDVLKSVAGLNVIPSTLNRMNPVFTIRGIYTGTNPQVLFLLNGSRIQGSFYAMGLDKLSHWPLRSIKRIEIIRGSGSALYGADAFAGVVNIITHDIDASNHHDMGLKFGSNNTRELWLNTNHQLTDSATISAYLNHYYQREDTTRMVSHDAQSSIDKLFSTSASLAPYHLSDKLNTLTYGVNFKSPHWLISVDGHHSRDIGIGAGAAQALDSSGYDDHDMMLTKIAYQDDSLFHHWSTQLTLEHIYSKTRAHFHIFPAGATLPVGNDGNLLQPHSGQGCNSINIGNIGCLTQFPDGVRGNPGSSDNGTSFQASFSNDHLNNHLLRIAIGWRLEKFNATEQKNFGPGVLDRKSLNGRDNPLSVTGNLTDVTGTEYVYAKNSDRQISHVLAQDIWRIIPSVTVTSGIRFDHYSDFGNTINPRFSIVWQSAKALTSKLLYSKAFRAPTVGELSAKNNPIQLGNSSLSPEEITTWELAFSHQTNLNLIQQLSFYHYDASNMINYVAQPSNGLSIAQNSASLEGKGFEYEISYLPIENVKLSASYSYQDTNSSTTNNKQAFVPRKKLDASLHWLLNSNVAVNLQYLRAHDRPRAWADNRPQLNNYHTFDVNLVYQFDKLQFKVAALNATNQQYKHASNGTIQDDYPAYDRRLYASVSYSW